MGINYPLGYSHRKLELVDGVLSPRDKARQITPFDSPCLTPGTDLVILYHVEMAEDMPSNHQKVVYFDAPGSQENTLNEYRFGKLSTYDGSQNMTWRCRLKYEVFIREQRRKVRVRTGIGISVLGLI